RGRDGGGDPEVGTAARRREVRRLADRRDVRLGLRRLRRERRRRAGARGDGERRAAPAQLRDHRRTGARRRAALRRRDRRLPRAARLNLTEALLEVAHGDERAVLFTVVEGEGVGRKLLVRLERAETFGDGPPGLAGLAPELRRSGIVEHEGSRVFAEVFGPPPRLIVVGAVDTGEALCAGARALGWHTVCVDARARFATHERVPSAEE